MQMDVFRFRVDLSGRTLFPDPCAPPAQTNSITQLDIVTVGSGYVDGDLRVLTSPNAGFLGTFVASIEAGQVIR